MRRGHSFLLFLALVTAPPPPLSAALKPDTLQGFERYIARSETRIAKEETHPGSFLSVDTMPAAERREALAELKQGRVFVTSEVVPGASTPLVVPGGLIHDWLGIVFIPGASLEATLHLVEDYNHHQDYYQPEVTRSKLLSRSGNDFKVFLRFHEKRIISVTLDTEHDIRYTQLDATRWYSRTDATRIDQVEDAGERGEHDLPPGDDDGYLWRMKTYWRFEERDGGVYVQCESISLTRDIPRGLGWLISPFVVRIPRESLEDTLGNTRAAVLKKR